MTVFSRLTERQQQALEGAKADSGTRKALAGRGLVAPDDATGFHTVTLTDKGRLVLLEHAQRDNKSEQFKAGDEVVAITSYVQGNVPVIRAERATVVNVMENGTVELRAAWGPRLADACWLAPLADAEAYGVVRS